jgi:L-threonylcarbamoyladenylate synthase
LRAAGFPLAAPSANTFTRTSATTAAHVLEDLDGRVDLILDGGPAPIGIESTVLLVGTNGTLRLLRPGAVPLEAVDAVLAEAGRPPVARGAAPAGATVAADAPAASPGQMPKHYAPRARLRYFRGPQDAARAALRAAAEASLARGQRVGLLLYREDTTPLGDVAARPGVVTEDLGPAADLEGVGRRLFAAMRRLDALGVDAILVRSLSLPATGLGLAIDDRLTRAAGGHAIPVEGDRGAPASDPTGRRHPPGSPP